MKTRTETRKRQVVHTVDGIPEMVDDEYDVIVPVAPRDWDHIVIRGVLTAAGVMVAISVVWSTASIGDFLARAVYPPIAYLGAVAFGLAWISCMALEWHARYDPARAVLPRRAGNVALLIEMGAVCAHGKVEDSLPVGIAGAVISAVAKGMWTVTLKYQSRPMSKLTQQWFLKREEQITARLALAARQRQLSRTEQHAAYSDAETAGQDRAGQDPGTVRAVQTVLSQVPGLSADEVLDYLTNLGIDHDEDTARAEVDKARDSRDSRSKQPLRSVSPVSPTMTDTITDALSRGVLDHPGILSAVQDTHGTGVDPATVRRISNREKKARSTA
ncbi:protein transporter Sec31 [Streptomyces sp. H27-C3]|uniref:protein transporter Sec31 n=1 Tax=Streptomyces sp. H27-C3 TaxID=3046305 RepID=UPI0024BB66A7|nr:protein transporter Sec31 [Streptomyces sp. H27-C3]MDJ0460610.1 protein transporter Sec31 [Streptomyces sp. H27-C3]